MQETDPRSQRIAVGLVVAAVVVALGYYFLVSSGYLAGQRSAPAQAHQQAHQQAAAGAPGAPGQPMGGPMAGAGGGNRDTSCPSGQVGALLGADMLKGHGALSGGGTGAQLITVDAGGPGDKAGLKPGDVVAACNGTETTCPQGLLGALSSADTKKDIVLQIERKGKPMTITVKPGSIGAK